MEGEDTRLEGGELTLEEFEQRERTHIDKRRKFFGIDDKAPLAGLALSGGGIRSATFCLGFLQALSARGLLRRMDYLSTVSGGSYMGSFFGALFVPAEKRGGGSARAERPAFDPTRPLQSPLGIEAVRRLRESGRYLTPAGTSDAFFGGAVVIRNWAAVQFVIGAAALLGFWLLHAFDLFVFDRTLLTSALSPTLLLLAGAAATLCTGAGAAYWLTRRDFIPGSRVTRLLTNLVFWFVLAALAYASAPWWAPEILSGWLLDRGRIVGWIAFVLFLCISCYAVAEMRHGAVDFTVKDDGSEEARDQRRRDLDNPRLLIAAEDRVRTALSGFMAKTLLWLLIFVGLLVVDAIAGRVPGALQRLSDSLGEPGAWWETVKSLWPVLVAAVPPVLSWLANSRLKTRQATEIGAKKGTRPKTWMPTVIVLVGALMVASWLMTWSAVSYFTLDALGYVRATVIALLFGLLLLNLVISLSFSFINLSSLSIFYAARLRRAYIGASSHGEKVSNLRKDDPQDVIGLDSYYTYGPENGAPAHIVNVTIAETVTESSSLVARDRKGKPLQVTPAGICHERDRPGTTSGHHRRWGEELPLSHWVAISGAAVAAAIGSGTSLGTSILTTMANVRLGYWWNRERARHTGSMFWSSPRDSVQNYLFSELRGAFHGIRRSRWYLTDGGHFENSGAYALLQRRVPLIIVCDNGADPDYAMADIVRLLGRARTDFGTHIRFLDEQEIGDLIGRGSPSQGLIGPYGELARRGTLDAPGGPLAAVAEIVYPATPTKGEERGLLLLVKPRLTYGEPPELLAYRAQPGCGDFPQQTTGDQFFDEVQWEAYRRLGELAGEKLFAQGSWAATELEAHLPAVAK